MNRTEESAMYTRREFLSAAFSALAVPIAANRIPGTSIIEAARDLGEKEQAERLLSERLGIPVSITFNNHNEFPECRQNDGICGEGIGYSALFGGISLPEEDVFSVGTEVNLIRNPRRARQTIESSGIALSLEDITIPVNDILKDYLSESISVQQQQRIQNILHITGLSAPALLTAVSRIPSLLTKNISRRDALLFFSGIGASLLAPELFAALKKTINQSPEYTTVPEHIQPLARILPFERVQLLRDMSLANQLNALRVLQLSHIIPGKLHFVLGKTHKDMNFLQSVACAPAELSQLLHNNIFSAAIELSQEVSRLSGNEKEDAMQFATTMLSGLFTPHFITLRNHGQESSPENLVRQWHALGGNLEQITESSYLIALKALLETRNFFRDSENLPAEQVATQILYNPVERYVQYSQPVFDSTQSLVALAFPPRPTQRQMVIDSYTVSSAYGIVTGIEKNNVA